MPAWHAPRRAARPDAPVRAAGRPRPRRRRSASASVPTSARVRPVRPRAAGVPRRPAPPRRPWSLMCSGSARTIGSNVCLAVILDGRAGREAGVRRGRARGGREAGV